MATEHDVLPHYSAVNTARASFEGRLCRIVNVASGTWLDHTVDREPNIIVGFPAASAKVRHWRVLQLGPGFAFRVAEDTPSPRYLAPTHGGLAERKNLALSTFPCFWNIHTTYEYSLGDTGRSPDVVEEWICAIGWPYDHNNGLVLDLNDFGRDTNVLFFPLRQPVHEQCQFWRIQFLEEAPTNSHPFNSFTPTRGLIQPPPSTRPSPVAPSDTLSNGAQYVIHNIKGRTVVDQDWGTNNKRVHGYQYANADNQRWEAIKRDEGWVFKNMRNGLFLSIEQDPTEGAKVMTTEPDAVWEVQRGQFERSQGEGVYRLVLQGTNYSLTLGYYGSWQNGTSIVLWQSWPGKNQTWRFEKVEQV